MGKTVADAEAVIKELEELAGSLKGEFPSATSMIEIMKNILLGHSVDAVPVVCCGECKHWHRETAYCELHSYFHDHEGLCCSPAESPNWTMWDEKDFCSDGERINEGSHKALASLQREGNAYG